MVDDLHPPDEENISVAQDSAVGVLFATFSVALDLDRIAGSIIEDQDPVPIAFDPAMIAGHAFFKQLDLVATRAPQMNLAFRQRKGPVAILLADNKVMVYSGFHEVFS